MSIRRGSTIIAGNIDAVYDTDEQTITINQNEKLQVIGTINKNTLTPKYDWVGTKAEYDALEEKNEDWLYFVTDDEKETVTLANCVGQIIQAVCTSSYIPNGCIPCDGTEYTADRFIDFWTNYLTSQPAKILTCTYNEYNTEITTYGQCAKFAVDTSSQKFKAPTIKDGSVIQQAMNDSELGKAYNAGLPNITGTFNTRRDNTANTLGTSGAFASEQYGNSDSFFYGNSNTSNGFKVSIDASRSSSIYGNSSTVQPNAIALRYFVVVVDTYLNQSQLDWTTYTQSLNNKADKNLVNTGLITNCITEIPQDIKLELNDGILKLKAGSKIAMPAGFETNGTTPKFDIITTSLDLMMAGAMPSTGTFMLFYPPEGTYLDYLSLNNCVSGSTHTEQAYSVWYDTTANLAKLYTTNASTPDRNVSLPLAIFTIDSTTTLITSIDQVFNGFGYIGSTVFALPGVKGLIPNGRNEDGNLRNIEVIINNVSTTTYNWGSSESGVLLSTNGVISPYYLNVANRYYDETLNYNFSEGSPTYGIIPVKFSGNAGIISNFQPKNVFHAVDYSEADFVVAYQRPTASNNYTWYRLYRSGWVEQGGFTNSVTDTGTVNLVITMQDLSYQIQMTVSALRPDGTVFSTDNNWLGNCWTSKTTTGFTVKLWDADSSANRNNGPFYWEVKGFAAGY